ncbi:MAG: MerR family transcriptional regulator [Erysipelotrichia bacterium]|nr:MerR family transcriptional regulator [Erysipelotrichia bacterium]
MQNLFSIGDLSKMQNISHQTLIYYDKIGFFCPAYVDQTTGYRYYSIKQLDYLDTICIMKKLGFSLEEIKQQLNSFTTEHSFIALRQQLSIINNKITELEMIKVRIQHRCTQLEQSITIRDNNGIICLEEVQPLTILIQKVDAPNNLDMLSIATKECFAYAFKNHLPIYFQSGAIVPYKNILQGHYTEASYAFLPTEKVEKTDKIVELPHGRCIYTYHIGDYLSIDKAYKRLLNYCQTNKIQIISDSYELAINDYLSTGDESEYITKIMFYIN